MNPSRTIELGNLFRHKLIREITIMTENEFNNELYCKFSCLYDPKTQAPLISHYGLQHFEAIKID